jgi:hypothetical protein
MKRPAGRPPWHPDQERWRGEPAPLAPDPVLNPYETPASVNISAHKGLTVIGFFDPDTEFFNPLWALMNTDKPSR